MNEEFDSNGDRIYRPRLLVAPSTSIDSWIEESRVSWKGLIRLVVLYEDHDHKEVLTEASLTASMLAAYPEAIPNEINWLFDKKDSVKVCLRGERKWTGQCISTPEPNLKIFANFTKVCRRCTVD
jgi:hypothetical protein